jgi:hypothetical protein
MGYFHPPTKIGPKAFSKYCLWTAAVWLLVLHPALLWFAPQVLPSLMRPGTHVDVYQYYSGAVAVREHIWDSLYSIPKAEVYDQPNHFVPAYRTFLFDPAASARERAFYPEFNVTTSSDFAPKMKQAFPEINDFSYVYPPPTALLCSPLALVSFESAANHVWPMVALGFLFVLAFFASRIYRELTGGDSYGEGLVILACLVFSARGQTDLPSGNVNPILSGCVACCCYSLLRTRLPAFSCAYIILVLFKGVGLAWLPLLVLVRTYRRALVYLGIISVVLNGIVLKAAGTGVYQKFFSLLPLISIPVGRGLVQTILHEFGFYPHLLYTVLYLAGLGLLYYGLLKNGDKGAAVNDRRAPLMMCAFLAGTLALFCLFNNVSWPEYGSNFLFFPLLGWIMQEGNLAAGAWRPAIRGGILLSFVILVGEGFWFWIVGKSHISFFQFYILFPYGAIVVPVFFLTVALRRLLTNGAEGRPMPRISAA